MALLHVSHPLAQTCGGSGHHICFFSNISWTPWVLDPIKIPICAPPGCTLLHPCNRNTPRFGTSLLSVFTETLIQTHPLSGFLNPMKHPPISVTPLSLDSPAQLLQGPQVSLGGSSELRPLDRYIVQKWEKTVLQYVLLTLTHDRMALGLLFMGPSSHGKRYQSESTQSFLSDSF